MIELQNKKLSHYRADGDLTLSEEMLTDYKEHSVNLETYTINDLEKHLWLANGAAITISLGFIQAKGVVSQLHVYGTWLFLAAIIMLVVMKFASAINSSRDRKRYQSAHIDFYSEKTTDVVFSNIRDKIFYFYKTIYLVTQYGSGLAFIIGCFFMVKGVATTL